MVRGAEEPRLAELTESPTPLNDLTDAQREEARGRFEVIRPFLEGLASLPAVAKENGKSLRTLRYWVSRYQDSGVAGLAHRTRSDHGEPRLRSKLQNLIKALMLKSPRRSVTSVYEEVAEEARRRGWKAPSYRQVLSIVRDIDPSLLKLAHEGTKAHKQAYDLLVRYEAAAPNERWQVDHKWLKVWVEHDGEPRKVCLTAVEDDYSRAIPGYYLHVEHPSSLCVALALRQAILAKQDARWTVCGIPAVLYNDNGPDFKSHHIEQVAAHLGARVDFSIPYQPRGRGKIERFFKTLDQRFVPRAPGFSPSGSPSTVENLLTLEQLDTLFFEWLIGSYHDRVHGETKQKPLERWEANGFFPSLPESAEELDLLLLTIADTRKVQRDGISFKNGKYLDLTLGAYIGEHVVIRYDPRDAGEIRIYHEGKFVCRAVCRNRAGESLSFKEVSRANSRRRKALRSQLRDIQKGANALLQTDSSEVHHGGTSDEPEIPGKQTETGEQKQARLKLYEHEW